MAPPAAHSALDGWVDVMRTGIWTDMNGNQHSYSAADLAQIAADYPASDPAPVVIGHPEIDAPAWGWVAQLRAVGDRLQARFTRINDAFRAACEAGQYGGRSVSIQRPADENGAWRLFHVGFLGAAAPAIEGLAPSQFATKPPDGAITHDFTSAQFTTPLGGLEERSGWATLDYLLRGLREWVIERSSIQTADRVLPGWGLNELKELGEPAESEMATLARPLIRLCAPLATTNDDDKTETPMSGTPAAPAAPNPAATQPAPNPAPDAGNAAQLAAQREDLATQQAQLATDRLAFAAARRMQAAQDTIEAHVNAGRVLPAERDALTALFTALEDEQTTVSFATGTGVQTSVTPARALDAFLAGLPQRGPQTGEIAGAHQIPGAPLDGGTATRDGQTAQHVALAARALMGSDPTGSMTIDQAVRQVVKGGHH